MRSLRADPNLSSTQIDEIIHAIGRLPENATKIYDKRNQQLYHFQAAGLGLVAKIYHLQNWKRKLAALLGFSRGRRSYRSGFALRRFKIPTPKPFLLLESGSGLFFNQVIVVLEYYEGPSLRECLERNIPLPDDAASQLRDIVCRLRRARLRHGDFHAANILISPQGRLALIDLDSMRRRILTSSLDRNLRDDRDRLLRSIKEPQTHQMVSATLGPSGSPLPCKSKSR